MRAADVLPAKLLVVVRRAAIIALDEAASEIEGPGVTLLIEHRFATMLAELCWGDRPCAERRSTGDDHEPRRRPTGG